MSSNLPILPSSSMPIFNLINRDSSNLSDNDNANYDVSVSSSLNSNNISEIANNGSVSSDNSQSELVRLTEYNPNPNNLPTDPYADIPDPIENSDNSSKFNQYVPIPSRKDLPTDSNADRPNPIENSDSNSMSNHDVILPSRKSFPAFNQNGEIIQPGQTSALESLKAIKTGESRCCYIMDPLEQEELYLIFNHNYLDLILSFSIIFLIIIIIPILIFYYNILKNQPNLGSGTLKIKILLIIFNKTDNLFINLFIFFALKFFILGGIFNLLIVILIILFYLGLKSNIDIF